MVRSINHENSEDENSGSELEFTSELSDRTFSSNSTRRARTTTTSTTTVSTCLTSNSNSIKSDSVEMNNSRSSSKCSTTSQSSLHPERNLVVMTGLAFRKWTRVMCTFTAVVTSLVFVSIICFFVFHEIYSTLHGNEVRKIANAHDHKIENVNISDHEHKHISKSYVGISDKDENLAGDSPRRQRQPLIFPNISQTEMGLLEKILQANITTIGWDLLDMNDGEKYVRQPRNSLKDEDEEQQHGHDSISIYENIKREDYSNGSNQTSAHSHFDFSNVFDHKTINASTLAEGMVVSKHSDFVANVKIESAGETEVPKKGSSKGSLLPYLLKDNQCLIPNLFKDKVVDDLTKIKQSKCTANKINTWARKECCYYVLNGDVEAQREYKDKDFWKTLVCTPFDPDDPNSASSVENSEFVRIQCKPVHVPTLLSPQIVVDPKKGKIETEFRAHVPLKSRSVRDKIQYWIDQSNQDVQYQKPTSVFILGLDTVSRHTFHTFLPKTRRLLLKSLNFVDMKGYHALGFKKMDNIIPLLMGVDKLDLSTSSVCSHRHRWKSFWDNDEEDNNCQFIWKKYGAANYVTLYAENLPDTFYYGNQAGFKKKPTDYFLRPFFVEKQKFDGNSDCFGNQTAAHVILSYVDKFVRKFSYFDTPFFSFAYLNGIEQQGQHGERDNNGEESVIQLTQLDVLLFKFFENLLLEKILDSTLFIILSSNGIRSGQGRSNGVHGYLDHRLPLLLIHPPSSLIEKYSQILRKASVPLTMQRNSVQITTPFDIHLTLEFILNSKLRPPKMNDVKFKGKFKAKSKSKVRVSKPCGQNLFTELPENRTCEQACIDLHWCACNINIEKFHEEIRVSSSILESQEKTQVQTQTQLLLQLIHKNGIKNLIMDKLNQMANLQRHSLVISNSRYGQCPQLSFSRFLYIGTSGRQSQNISYALSNNMNVNGKDVLIVGIQVSPDDARYEVILQKYRKRNHWTILSPIIRIDSSKGYTFCINTIKFQT